VKYNAKGQIILVAGTGVGLYAANGAIKYKDASLTAGRQGAYSPEGYLWVTILANELTRVPMWNADGSLNVVEGAGKGWYSPCGAWNVDLT
jgi:hypothetical protein